MTRRTDGDATRVEPRRLPRRPTGVNRTPLAAPAAVLTLALLLSGCAERSTGATPAATPTTPAAQLPAGDALVLRVQYVGGFVTPEMLAGRLPLVSVYADGRVISEGPVAAIHPGPAWPNVLVHQADRATVQQLVDAALAAGIAETTDLGSPGIADAPATRFTLSTAEGTTVREVYALREGDGDPMLTEEQQAERAELLELFTELTDLPSTLAPAGSAPAAYEPTAIAALVRPEAAAEGDPILEPLADQPALAWPGPALPGEPIAPDLTCVLASGDQARAVREAAQGANALTPWTTGDGARWSLSFRPLLPQETGCADLGD